jgi:hypothetical protein
MKKEKEIEEEIGRIKQDFVTKIFNTEKNVRLNATHYMSLREARIRINALLWVLGKKMKTEGLE